MSVRSKACLSGSQSPRAGLLAQTARAVREQILSKSERFRSNGRCQLRHARYHDTLVPSFAFSPKTTSKRSQVNVYCCFPLFVDVHLRTLTAQTNKLDYGVKLGPPASSRLPEESYRRVGVYLVGNIGSPAPKTCSRLPFFTSVT